MLGALTSLTGGGAMAPSSSASQDVANELSTGSKSVGGLTLNAKASNTNTLVMAGAAVAVVGILAFALRR